MCAHSTILKIHLYKKELDKMCQVSAIKAYLGNLTGKKLVSYCIKATFFDRYLYILGIEYTNLIVCCRLYSLLHLGEDNDQSISVQEGAEGVTAAWLARRAHINRIPNGEFHAVNFRQIMAYILHDTSPM